MYFPRLLFIGFSFIVMSCGNDSSSNMSSTDDPVNSQTYPSNPIVWDVVTPETVGMNSSYCLLYTSPSPRDQEASRIPSSA